MKTLNLFTALLIILACFGCESSDIKFTYSDSYSDVSSGNVGVGGSMARFTIVGNYLYTVDGRTLKTFDISSKNATVLKSDWQLEWNGGIETIFPYNNMLFLGTTTGMHIIDVSNPENPKYKSHYEHIVSCDPVVVQGNYAYVTLHSSDNGCWRGVNELQIIDISDITNPKEIKSIPMNSPRGLGIDGNKLFVCDNGLKVYTLNSPTEPVQINHFSNLKNTYDVIPINGLLMLIGEDGLHQYAYENNSISKISSITVKQ